MRGVIIVFQVPDLETLLNPDLDPKNLGKHDEIN